MHYPIVIHKEEGTDYGVTVPDLPGCFSAGSTTDEALTMAQEAIELHLEGMIEDGEAIPQPGTIEDLRNNPEYAGGTWALVAIDPSKLRLNAKRINITMPQRVLDTVDRYAAAHGSTRSGLLLQAVTAYMARKSDSGTVATAGRRTRRATGNRGQPATKGG